MTWSNALLWTVATGFWIGTSAWAENWPAWRGARGDGVSSETNLPVRWTRDAGVLWKAAVPGEGHSSAVVWGESVFVTSADRASGERWLLHYRSSTGELVWKRMVLQAPTESMHSENSPASSTPVTDGQRIFTSFQNGARVNIQCWDFAGKQVWTAEPLRFEGQHGYSYTPIVTGDLVIFDFAQNEEPAVVALEKASGQVRWRYNRAKDEISHVTPLLVRGNGADAAEQVIVCGADEIRALRPATGESIWWCNGPTDVCVAGMVFGDETVFATGGYPRRTRMAVSIQGLGDVTKSGVIWRLGREVSYVPSPVFVEGHVYTVLDDGLLNCFEAKSGQAVWQERLGGRFRSSLVYAEGRIYATNDKGQTTVFRATPERFERVALNDLAEFCYATPAIAGGRIFLRAGSNLYCIGSELQARR